MLFKQTVIFTSAIATSLLADASMDLESLFELSPQQSEEVSYTDTYSYSSSTQDSGVDNRYPGRGMPLQVFAGAPDPTGGVHLATFIEFLYWDSGINQYSLFTGQTLDGEPVFAGSKSINRILSGFQSHFDPGFRIGIQHGFSAQGWDVVGSWAYFHNKKHQTSRNSELNTKNAYNVVTWENSNVPFWPAVVQENTWFLNYNQADFAFGKEIYFTQYYSLRPSLGARYVHAKSGFNLRAIGAIDPVDFATNHMHNTLSIFGATVGVDNKFLFGHGFSLLGNLSAGLMYGPNQVSYTSVSNYSLAAPDNPLTSTNHLTARDIIPAFDARIDIGWEYNLNKGKQVVSLRAGYEYHVLMQAFTTVTFPLVSWIDLQDYFEDATVDHTTLFLQGLNVGVNYSF